MIGSGDTPIFKILLVEDNEMNRDMLSRRLTRKGYQVVLAVDGQTGLDMAESEAPDIVLMDMSLPILDGWEATRRLKAKPETRHVPVIALTAHAMSGDRDKALEAGCNDYDTKPIDLPRLLAKIEALLASSAARKGPPGGARVVTEGERPPDDARYLVPAALLHDLRTPLSQMLGYSEMLLEESEASGNEHFVQDLKKIRAAGWKLLALMDANFQPSRALLMSDAEPGAPKPDTRS